MAHQVLLLLHQAQVVYLGVQVGVDQMVHQVLRLLHQEHLV